MGRRLDMILKRKKIELGAGEAGDRDTKSMRERDLKLPKALKDIITGLKNERRYSGAEKLEMVGLLQYGFKMTRIKMNVPMHYVHRVLRTKNLEVPSDWDNVPNFRRVLYMVLFVKGIVSETIKQIQSQPDENGNLSIVMKPPKIDPHEIPSTFASP